MTRLLVERERLGQEVVVVSDEDHRYLTRVLRLVEGDRVVLFDGEGQEAEARVLRTGPRATELRLDERRVAAAPTGPVMTLIQALAKGEKLDLVVQKATELGVSRVIPVVTARAIPRLELDRATSRRERWNKIAQEASRQCGRATVPQVEPILPWATAVQAASSRALRLVFWEGAKVRGLASALPTEPPPEVVIAIGPEGGLTEEEVEIARAVGFEVVGFGPRILRTETAALAALAVLQFALGDLR